MTLGWGIGAEPSRIDLLWGDLGVVKRGKRRLNRHLLIALVEVVAKLDTPDTDDRYLVLNRVGHGCLLTRSAFSSCRGQPFVVALRLGRHGACPYGTIRRCCGEDQALSPAGRAKS